jgi:Protein kinase domain.
MYISVKTLFSKRKVAIKFVDDPEDERRLLDEISALQNVRSKHVVQIYDVFRDESAPCYGIVLEYLGLAEFRLWAFPTHHRRISRPARPGSGDHSFTPRS